MNSSFAGSMNDLLEKFMKYSKFFLNRHMFFRVLFNFSHKKLVRCRKVDAIVLYTQNETPLEKQSINMAQIFTHILIF